MFVDSTGIGFYKIFHLLFLSAAQGKDRPNKRQQSDSA
jgi:hypothetical protein